MQAIPHAEDENGGGSDPSSHSEDAQFPVAVRKMVKEEIQVVMISTFQEMIRPHVEDIVRKVVKEEISSAIEKYVAGGMRSNAVVLSNERNLRLMFLDEVSDDVLTGKEITGKGGTLIRVAIFDQVGQVIDSGPESSAKVEILFLESSAEDNKHNCSHEEFNHRIIKESDRTKPHFAKSYHVYLEKGTGMLKNAKLAHDSNYMKNCRCRLGARVVENFSGIEVQEAWTEPFMVSDRRNKLYGKRYPPLLSDSVWRLDKIQRDGEPCKRLNKNKVSTVWDFLLLHSVDPQRLQEIIGSRNPAWTATLAHAQTCSIDVDKRICVYNDSSECNMKMVFNVIEGLKGVIQDSQYVLINDLTEAVEVRARELLCSAFENRDCITFHSNETTLMPYQGNFAATTTSSQENFPGFNPTIPENMNQSEPTEPATSSQGISPSVRSLGNANNISDLNSLGLSTMGQGDHLSSDYSHDYTSWFSVNYGCDQNLMSLFSSEGNNLPETQVAEAQSFQGNNFPGTLVAEAQSFQGNILPGTLVAEARCFQGNNLPGTLVAEAQCFQGNNLSETFVAEAQCFQGNNLPETHVAEAQCFQKSDSRIILKVRAVVHFTLLMLQSRKRVMSSGDIYASKRQRI